MKYFGKISIDIKNKSYCSTINISFCDEELVTEFLIHKKTNIKSIKLGDEPIAFRLREENLAFIPEGIVIELMVDKPLNKNSSLCFEIENTVKDMKNGVNTINAEHIELNIYSPWYPTPLDLRNFEYDILAIGIDNFYVSGGSKEDEGTRVKGFGNDIFIIGYREPIIEIVDVSKKVSVVSYENSKVKTVASIVARNTQAILDYFKEVFPFTSKIESNLEILISSRELGGGYCRNGLILITAHELTEEQYDRYLSHELSHIWLVGAPVMSWEDWLNESFAEYVSLLYTEKKYGKDRYDELIPKYRSIVEDAPPIRDSDRNSEGGSKARYKGTVLLHEVREKFGLELVIEMINILVNLKEKLTDKYLGLLRDDVAEFVRNKLIE